MATPRTLQTPATAAARRWRTIAQAGLVVALVAIWPTTQGYWRYHAKRFQEVRAGLLSRSGQPSERALAHFVRDRGIRTIVNLKLHDSRLRAGLADPGEPDGEPESAFVTQLGVEHVQWPMGDEIAWPWLTPWQFEQFFRLLDDSARHPIAVHCMGGRHRTGTFSALFRLEYDRWPVERALSEMYSFGFGPCVPLQEHHLRTYVPRPLPTAAETAALWAELASQLAPPVPRDYAALVRRLRHELDGEAPPAALQHYVALGRPFALSLAARLIERPDDLLAPLVCRRAMQALDEPDTTTWELQSAVALLADYGTPSEQQYLLQSIERATHEPHADDRSEAIVAGVTNRYTPNRAPFLRVLLEDERRHVRPAAREFRYCDTAVARLSAIAEVRLLPSHAGPTLAEWNVGRAAARTWFDEHPREAALSQLRPAGGRNLVRAGDGPEVEDRLPLRR